ncbi:hypothetical protein NL676_016151 [Syzygium grande]|nr:hypothetical protein NL676_016151 [Syzygium grande]
MGNTRARAAWLACASRRRVDCPARRFCEGPAPGSGGSTSPARIHEVEPLPDTASLTSPGSALLPSTPRRRRGRPPRPPLNPKRAYLP